MNEPIYQPIAECPVCKKRFDVKNVNIQQTCPKCFKLLKILKKKDWRRIE